MDSETATPRARAAWAYSGKDQKKLAVETERLYKSVNYNRLRAILGIENYSDVALEELFAIADAAGVPRDFMEHGWPATPDERIRDLEERQKVLGRTVATLAAEVGRLRRESPGQQQDP